MRWECSECGDDLEADRAPEVCHQCGLAGSIFVAIDPAEQESVGDLRAFWVRAGLARAERRMQAAT